MSQQHLIQAKRVVPPWHGSLVIALLGVLWWFLLPDQLGLLVKVAYTCLLVISLDLVVGVAGLPSLGHAAIFGVGAYAAGYFALHISGDPLIGLLIGGLAGGIAAFISGLFVLRYEGFTFLMLTIAIAQIIQNLASKFRDYTGGDDGLTGFSMKPIAGIFPFDLEGKTAALYALAALVIGYYLCRRIVDSPFGLAVRGIHENRARMAALGTPIYLRLLTMYTFAGIFAGFAGAIAAQTNAIVALDSLSFSLSAEILVMLVLGGVGRLSGAVIGAVIFTLLHHTAASINPYHWLFVISFALMFVVMFPPRKILKVIGLRFGFGKVAK